MNVEVHIVTYNEERILPWTLRHYGTFAARIVVHDSFSTDRTREIAWKAGAEVIDWDTVGQVNDQLLSELKNSCWLGTKAQWVIVCDADEFLWFPNGVVETFAAYEKCGGAVIKAEGWEMTAEEFPEPRTGNFIRTGQIYDYVKHGARENHYCAKPILFNPRLVRESGFGIGAHESRPVLKDGRLLDVSRVWPFPDPPTYLLHFHHVGPISVIAERYDRTIKRASKINRDNNWGSYTPGIVTATTQRNMILANLQKVIP